MLDSGKLNTRFFSEQIYFSIVGFQDGQINFDKSPRFAAEAEGHRGKKYRRRNKTTQDGIRGNRIIFTIILIYIGKRFNIKYFHCSKNVKDEIKTTQNGIRDKGIKIGLIFVSYKCFYWKTCLLLRNC